MRQPMSARSGSRRGKTPAARNCRTKLLGMAPHSLSDRIASLPKAELHLHLEGSIQPATVCALTARHGANITQGQSRPALSHRDFPHIIESFQVATPVFP